MVIKELSIRLDDDGDIRIVPYVWVSRTRVVPVTDETRLSDEQKAFLQAVRDNLTAAGRGVSKSDKE